MIWLVRVIFGKPKHPRRTIDDELAKFDEVNSELKDLADRLKKGSEEMQDEIDKAFRP